VGIGRPRIGIAESRDERPKRRCGRGPQAERTVDVEPRIRALADRGDDLGQWIEGTGVDVARLSADEDRPVDSREDLPERVRPHPALAVGSDAVDAATPQAEHLERGEDRDVGLVADDDGNRWRPEQPVLFGIPAGRAQHRVAPRGEGRKARHRRAGREPHARARRQAEQVDEPRRRDLLRDRSRRRDRVQPRVLVPRARQPVRRKGRRDAATDDEPEVPRPGAADKPGIGGCDEIIDHGRGVDAGSRHLAPHGTAECGEVNGSRDRPLGERFEVVRRVVGGLSEELSCAHVVPCPSPGGRRDEDTGGQPAVGSTTRPRNRISPVRDDRMR
jgi:hypothetical protein